MVFTIHLILHVTRKETIMEQFGKKNRLLGVDYGDTRTGLAVSDPLGILASGIGYIHSTYDREVAQKVAEAAASYGVAKIVLGYPVNMNGTHGPRAEKAEAFRTLLAEYTQLPVILYDERLTTAAAHRILHESNRPAKKRKTVVDTLSAQILLQNYMDSEKNT